MKRKKSKLIGLVLIISAILLQVGYAAAATVAGVARTRDFEVQINSRIGEQTEETSEYVKVDLESDTEKNGIVRVQVDNLYPGAYFTVLSTITNLGKEIRLKSVEVKPTGKGNKELYNNLVFYDEQNNEMTQEAYKTYLKNKHKDMKLEQNGIIDFKLKMGLSPEVTELEGETTQFLIEIAYDQAEPGDNQDTGETGSNPNSGGPGTPNNTAAITPTPPVIPTDTEIIDENIPGGPVKTEIVDEDIPGGASKTEIVDEDIPGGPAKLPKTGGISALFVYAFGLVMLAGGIIIFRKSKEQE